MRWGYDRGLFRFEIGFGFLGGVVCGMRPWDVCDDLEEKRGAKVQCVEGKEKPTFLLISPGTWKLCAIAGSPATPRQDVLCSRACSGRQSAPELSAHGPSSRRHGLTAQP